jgi:hypothetical protein
MSGPDPVPLIDMPDWLAGVQAGFSGASGGRLSNIEALQEMANAINPRAGTVNCGWNIDSVIARFTGADPNATTNTTGMDGNWSQIEQRHNTTLTWGSSFQAAFDAVKNGGPGTAAIVSIVYPGGKAAHVVAMVNMNGTVGIVEGQDWGNNNPREVITDAARANARYNANSNIGFGIVGAGAPALPPGH